MSTITTDSRITPGVSRPTALRAADGVIAGYIHSLIQAAAEPSPGRRAGRPSRPASRTRECRAGGAGALAGRRRPVRRAVAAAA